jgi:ferric-dicitrate binding protein FerR (iron transport regulator)
MNQKYNPFARFTPDAIGELVHSAGPRALPDTERMAQARLAVHTEWRASLEHGRRERRKWLSAAAVAALAIGAGIVMLLQPPPAVQVATASRVVGSVTVQRPAGVNSRSAALHGDERLLVGDRLKTDAESRTLIRWERGALLRVDQQSRLALESDRSLRLEQGALYVEVDERSANVPDITVLTALGTIRHVGTRFEVRVTEGAVRVRVRDGTAVFKGDSMAATLIGAGQQLSIDGEHARLEQGPAASDPSWDWTRRIAPSFAIEGRSVFDTLEWLSHESGLEIRYADDAVQARARAVTLHGSIEGLGMREALIAVLTGSGLSFELAADRVEIRRTPEST